MLLVVMLVLLLVAGLALGFRAARPAADAGGAPAACRHRPAGLPGARARRARGSAWRSATTGSAARSRARWTQLTDPDARPRPPNEPGRLTAVGSVRARYWNEALKIFAGRAGRSASARAATRRRAPRYRNDDLDVRHAHGYVVQTLADLGIAGLLVSLALLAAWLAAAGRATGLRARDRGEAATPRRARRAADARGRRRRVRRALVVDWTWFVPGNAVMALAGRRLAGRPRADRQRAGSGASRLGRLRRRPRGPTAARHRRRRGAARRAGRGLDRLAAAALGRRRPRRARRAGRARDRPDARDRARTARTTATRCRSIRCSSSR